MKKQKGEVILATVIACLVAGFLVVVTNGGQRNPVAETPQDAKVTHNYNGGFTK